MDGGHHMSPLVEEDVMHATRGSFGPLIPTALLALFLASGCAVERDATEKPAAEAVTMAIQIPDTEAGAVLASALAEARQTNRNVLAHTGADW